MANKAHDADGCWADGGDFFSMFTSDVWWLVDEHFGVLASDWDDRCLQKYTRHKQSITGRAIANPTLFYRLLTVANNVWTRCTRRAMHVGATRHCRQSG